MRSASVFFAGIVVLAISGCSSIAGSTNMLTDEKIRSSTAGTLGYSPDELVVTNRRTEGTNTYVNVKAKDGKEFACTINGGNLLSFGMVNPPACNRKGQPRQTGAMMQ
ncbi:hypothetical protein FNF07_06535 [Trinickia caryophylli]|uniref:Beta-barrel assembly machine subunit BamE n=2 Tax=Trinickia caryophylli TaxID=28094 RepID=A0A1X7DXR4_TRICW|nr:hypothetical protein C0Z17_01410 [Trinickia caryophylli]TRX20232.1 hypothetical protein FNF07_06535 [Trinickia caryophylli]SMF23162.1 hypothetical protein SAMN06295900_104158 [Trinickia caryophylli]